MCAVLILGVALAGLTEGMITALRSSKDSETLATAAQLAAGQMETLRANKSLTDGETEGKCAAAFPKYGWKQTIAPAQMSGLHEITVAIVEPESGKQVYELKTMLFDPDSASQDSKAAKPASDGKKQDRAGGRRGG